MIDRIKRLFRATSRTVNILRVIFEEIVEIPEFTGFIKHTGAKWNNVSNIVRCSFGDRVWYPSRLVPIASSQRALHPREGISCHPPDFSVYIPFPPSKGDQGCLAKSPKACTPGGIQPPSCLRPSVLRGVPRRCRCTSIHRDRAS